MTTTHRKARTAVQRTIIAACPHCGLKMRLEAPDEGDVYECSECELELTLRDGRLTMEDAVDDDEPSDDLSDEASSDDAPRQPKGAEAEKGRGTSRRRAAQAERSSNPNRSAAAALKELPEPTGPEVEVLRTCPAYWRVSPFAVLGTSFAMLLGAGLATWMAVRNSPIFMVGVCVLIVLINAVVFAHGWLRTRATELRITNKRIIDRDGLLTRHISEVLHKDIKSVRIKQTMWQRMRGIGEIAISTDGDEGPEVYMACVTEPKKVQKIIDHYRL